MKIRPLTYEEFDSSTALDEYAFQFVMEEKARQTAKERFRPEQVWGAFDDSNKLMAHYTLLPFQIYLQGKGVPMGGIAGVATWPENRRQGLVAQLLGQALEVMREQGQVLSFLHPFKIPFYRRFGWEVFCEYKKYRIPAAQFPAWSMGDGQVKRGSADVELLNALYSQFASVYNGAILRTKEWWEHAVLSHGNQHAVYYTRDGRAEGYIVYRITNRSFIIEEMVYSGEEARRGLWGFVVNHDSMVTHAECNKVPSDDYLPYLLDDPRIPQENYPYFMARIVDVAAFMEVYRFAAGSAGQLLLWLSDSHAPWNQGLWRIGVSPVGTAQAIRTEGDRAQAEVCTDIGTLTAVLLGYRTAEEMAATGRATASPETLKRLGGRLPKARTALFDFF